MKFLQLLHFFRSRPDSGSALILVLLITALLSTIVVSFLSTSRVEQMASRNFSRQNAASGLAEAATQIAISNLNTAFTSSANMSGNYTAIVTSQPGRIQKFFFQNGTYTKNASADLFFNSNSTNANGTVNMNNLDNSTSSPHAGLITGNPSESITVYFQDIKDPSGNNTTARIAYYIDDEATKVNLNAATSLRSALNAAGPRPLSLSGANITNSSGLSQLDSIVAGTASGTDKLSNWAYFFRPEQGIGAGVLSKKTLRDLANITTVVPSIYTNSTTNKTYTNSLYSKTPWGSEPLCINVLSTNATNGQGDLSVLFIHEALTGNKIVTSNSTGTGPGTRISQSGNSTYSISGLALNNIFGGNFSTKYTDIGVKQIAANMLQMRDPNTSTVNASFSYNGPLIGSINLNATNSIPNEYFGYAPYPVITEVGVAINPGGVDWAPGGGFNVLLSICPTIEVTNPYPFDFINSNNAELDFDIDQLAIDIDHGSGPLRHIVQKTGVSSASWIQKPSGSLFNIGVFFEGYSKNGSGAGGAFKLPDIPRYSKIQYQPDWSAWFCYSFVLMGGDGLKVTGISNATVKINNVRIKVGSQIRDWVTGVETGPINSNIYPENYPWGPANNAIKGKNWIFKSSMPPYRVGNLTDSSTQRIDWILKNPMNAAACFTANDTANLTLSESIRVWTTTNSNGLPTPGFPSGNWTESASSWINPNLDTALVQATDSNPDQYNSKLANPSFSQSSEKPSDPSFGDKIVFGVYGNETLDMREPVLPSGNYTCPSDLGLVPTNMRWRRLRMQMQPSQEASQNLIPDWAMLDIIAFNDTGYRPSGSSQLETWTFLCNEGTWWDFAPGSNVAYGGDGNYVYKVVSGLTKFWSGWWDNPNPGNNKAYLITKSSSSNYTTTSSPPLVPTIRVNPNGKFHVANGTVAPSPRTAGLKALVKTLDSTSSTGTLSDPMSGNNITAGDKIRFMGNNSPSADIVAGNIANMTWSSQSTWDSQRNKRKFPSGTYLLPSEVCEIAGVSDVVDQTNYNNSSSHFKWNEGRVSAILPGLTTCSSFFSIYAYAQVLDKAGNLESEALTKTMVEVEITNPSTFSPTGTIAQPGYKVKKLYTQSIPLGQ